MIECYIVNLSSVSNMSASAHRLIFSIKYITHLCIINTYFFFLLFIYNGQIQKKHVSTR